MISFMIIIMIMPVLDDSYTVLGIITHEIIKGHKTRIIKES